MNKPVIVIVINYRLSHFGFLGSQELALEFDLDPSHLETSITHDQDEAYGNWGLHDQKLAFRWFQNHIHTFGGDGHDLTAMGPSGGGSSLLYHVPHDDPFPPRLVHPCDRHVRLDRGARNILDVHVRPENGGSLLQALWNQSQQKQQQ
jgi:carboxylesterase type B